MAVDRSQAEKDRDAGHNESARLESAARDRARSLTENLEEGLVLQAHAVEFARAFAEGREQRGA